MVEIITVECNKCGHVWNWQEPKTGWGWEPYEKEWNVPTNVAIFIHRTARLRCNKCGIIVDCTGTYEFTKSIVDRICNEYHNFAKSIDGETMIHYFELTRKVPTRINMETKLIRKLEEEELEKLAIDINDENAEGKLPLEFRKLFWKINPGLVHNDRVVEIGSDDNKYYLLISVKGK